MTLAYLNGEYLPLAKAQVSAMDRGFLFGDAVYEVIPFYNGKGLGLAEHLQRLEHSLAAIEIPQPLTNEQWQKIFARLLENTHGDHKIYLQISRGAALERTFSYPARVQPTVFAFEAPFKRGQSCQGIKAITVEDIRWRDCYIKSNNLLASCLSTELAKRHHCDEAILHRDDQVTEGASSNVFVVKDGSVLTTPANPHILSGISRQLVLQILAKENIPHAEVHIPLATLHAADEIWITSSTREIAPVIELNNHPVGSGKPGPIWQRAYPAYMKLVDENELDKSFAAKESLLKFPCEFPIKIIGKTQHDLRAAVLKILGEHAADFAADSLKVNMSKDGNYQALTAVIHARSKQQLDAIYQALTTHEFVVMAL